MVATAIKTILFSILCILYGCAAVRSDTGNSSAGISQLGLASYYADKFQNRKTASGEVYRHSSNTAAHRSLPFGTLVKVTHIENGKSVVVKINDRGPFAKGRIIDLSKSAFRSIGSTSSGLIRVRIEVVE